MHKSNTHIFTTIGTWILAVGVVLGTLLFGLFSGHITDQGLFGADLLRAAGDWDLRVNSEALGASSVLSGNTVMFKASVDNLNQGSEQIATFTVVDTLPVGAEFTGVWSKNIPGSIVSPPAYDETLRRLSWVVTPYFPSDDVLELTYEVRFSQEGSFQNLVEVVPDGAMPEESVPYASGSCTPGVNPLNDGEFAVADTNNVDCFRVIVIGEQQPGQCGADDGEYFYRPDQPVALCDQGTASVPVYTAGTGWHWNCIGANNAGVDECAAVEEYCGDRALQADEHCDDGNNDDNDGCTASCEIEGCTLREAYNYNADADVDDGSCRYCGDGNPELIEGEACDLGTDENTGTCDAPYNGACMACTESCDQVEFTGGVCGDGIVQGPEACDDGNTSGDDGCSADCLEMQSGRTCPVAGAACIDDDECAGAGSGNTCHANAQCTNTPGSYECACDAGFVGDGVVCVNINECIAETDTCDPVARCTDTPGSYECACPVGYSGDGETCIEDNECVGEGAGNRCALYATCTNTPGSYECTCEAGFVGDGFTCETVCGDNVVGGLEQCDDGNSDDNDGCSSTCSWESISCSMLLSPTSGSLPLNVSGTVNLPAWAVVRSLDWGNGVIDESGSVDVAHSYNAVGKFGVTTTIAHRDNGSIVATCGETIEAATVCGNAVAEPGEECDAGTENGVACMPEYGENCSYCTATCEVVSLAGSYCGDGIVNESAGESCDLGAAHNTGTCDAAYESYCTGCTSACETVQVYGGECGDGVKQGPEGCDDGNFDNDDMCSIVCTEINRYSGSSSSIGKLTTQTISPQKRRETTPARTVKNLETEVTKPANDAGDHGSAEDEANADFDQRVVEALQALEGREESDVAAATATTSSTRSPEPLVFMPVEQPVEDDELSVADHSAIVVDALPVRVSPQELLPTVETVVVTPVNEIQELEESDTSSDSDWEITDAPQEKLLEALRKRWALETL